MMFVTNEQASSAIDQTPMLIRSSLKDVETFLKDIHHQVTFTVHEGFNALVDRIKIDLEGNLDKHCPHDTGPISQTIREQVENKLCAINGMCLRIICEPSFQPQLNCQP